MLWIAKIIDRGEEEAAINGLIFKGLQAPKLVRSLPGDGVCSQRGDGEKGDRFRAVGQRARLEQDLRGAAFFDCGEAVVENRGLSQIKEGIEAHGEDGRLDGEFVLT